LVENGGVLAPTRPAHFLTIQPLLSHNPRKKEGPVSRHNMI